MPSKETLRRIVMNQKASDTDLGDTVRRTVLDKVLDTFNDRRIVVLTGLRRSGKSTLLRQLMGLQKDYCYVSFEDERFLNFKTEEFESLNEVLVEVYGSPKTYFFDEIQNIEMFELFVRRLHDERKKVVITGSNASLLSGELGTRLTGRYVSFEVFPFSFAEYLAFANVRPEKDWPYVAEKKVLLEKMFSEYAEKGGLPEYLRNPNEDYPRNLYENVLNRDIIARYSIKRQKVLKELVSILITNISSKFTYNSLKNALGLANAITVKEYISYLQNAFLFFEVLKFDRSVKKQLNAPRKIYTVDPAFNRSLGADLSVNHGKVLENLVYLELRRRNREVYYFQGTQECDFVTKTGNSISGAIQVCHELLDSSREREFGGLLEAMRTYGLSEGLVLTREQEEELLIDGNKIKIMPAWRWLLDANR